MSGRNYYGPAGARWCAGSSTASRCISQNPCAMSPISVRQNWQRGHDGKAYVTDFQLAACFKTRSRLFRIAAYEDLRHLLKHKRSYAPEALTPKERKILARKSLVTRI